MNLTDFMNSTKSNKQEWIEKGYSLIDFDRENVKKVTKSNPKWIHFGPGNIFRAFIAKMQQELLTKGTVDTGIIVAEGFDYEIIEKTYRTTDNIFLAVTLHVNGFIEKTVVGSVTESLIMDSENADWERLKSIFTEKGLQIASFTITEKGYNLKNQNGEYYPYVLNDFEQGPGKPIGYIGKVAALCYERYLAGGFPISFVSMDNCSKNGLRLYEALNTYAEEWEKRGLVKPGFVKYINDKSKVGFPWSMIDKITPRPSQSIAEALEADGFDNVDIFTTAKGSYAASFVNAEETGYLVIEDWFPNGRPELEKGGLIFTKRETVEKVERMKVCTCLNPLHTALAVFGCLLGYSLISKEMKDPDLKKMVEIIGYKEGLPVVVDPGIINPKEFLDTVINVRFPNEFIPDTPQRIATDTSQKLAIRFGETIKAYIRSEKLDVGDLKIIPLVFAGWCRYLMGTDDNGEAFRPSSDPIYEEVYSFIKDIKLGDTGSFHKQLHPIFSNEAIFGVNLYDTNLGNIAEGYFAEMIAGPGAVRKTVNKYVNKV
ncbi:MAG: mannitol dehydrogenase family protein [Eubacteriales bacterium]|nr:mannitol dehydrogenase family protein [Eubacteriales bacterium]